MLISCVSLAAGTIHTGGTADAQANYGGSIADGAIPDKIYDGNDDIAITGSIEYLPNVGHATSTYAVTRSALLPS